MKNLRDVVVRRRPLPSSADPVETGDPEQASGFLDRDSVRAGRYAPDGHPERTLGEAADPSRNETPELTASAANPAQKKQIWDLEDGDREDDALHPRERSRLGAAAGETARATPLARARAGLDPDAGENPATSTATRVKTRIIGFHAGDAGADVFAAKQAAPSATGQFPAGWLVVVEGPGRGASFSIGAGVSTVGRGADQTVCLDFGDTSISRENHASIAYDEEQNSFFVGHGGKSNIVRRNGNPVLATEDLVDADLIRIGKTTLRFVALCGPDFTWGSTEDRQDTDAPGS